MSNSSEIAEESLHVGSMALFNEQSYQKVVEEQDQDMLGKIRTLPLEERCETLDKLLFDKTEYSKTSINGPPKSDLPLNTGQAAAPE